MYLFRGRPNSLPRNENFLKKMEILLKMTFCWNFAPPDMEKLKSCVYATANQMLFLGDKSNAKESDSFQKIDRKKKATKISSNQTSPPQSKNSILAALEIANGKSKNSSGKTTSISKLSEKVKEDQKKSQAFDEQEFEPILTRKNVMKNDVDERSKNFFFNFRT